MKRVAIIGAGDLGVQLAHHLRAMPGATPIGFFDDTRPVGAVVADIQVLGNVNDVEASYRLNVFDELLIGIGYKHLAVRQALFERFRTVIPFARLIHPHAWIDPTCVVEPGAVIYPGCVVDMYATVGANALLNVGCVIAHHSSIGKGCFISPGVKVAGFVRVEEMSTLGIGTIVIDNITIVSGVRTGAGAVVVDDIREPGLYVGVPAKFKKRETIA
jgi:sugar O-acyltransferase (sialic acid O-acetyltransferase NeuD family)